MNICMVLQGTYPTDIRVEKEVNSLLDAGHEVTILCRSVDSLEQSDEMQPREIVDGATVWRINDWEPFGRLVWQQLNFDIRFRKPIWEDALTEIVTEGDFDIIHVHDLPPVKSTLAVAQEHDIPVVADLHELYPAAMKVWRSGWSWKRKLKRNVIAKPIWRYRRLQRKCLRAVDHTLTVSEEAKQQYVENGVPSEDVTVVGNMVDLDSFDALPRRDVVPEYEDDFLITYVGGFGPHRGLDMAVRGLPEILESLPNARLLLVGKSHGESYDQKLRSIASSVGVSDRVTFTGWVDFEDVPSYMAASDICVVLHRQSEHTDIAIPHKLSQYMAMGKPLVVTTRPPLERIVSETSCGLSVPYNPSAFAAAIVTLAENDEQRDRCGRNARAAAEDRYNWSTQSNKLLTVYESVT